METDDVYKYARAADYVEMFPQVDPEEVYQIAMANDDDDAVTDELQALCDRNLAPSDAPSDADFIDLNGGTPSDDNNARQVFLGRHQQGDPVADETRPDSESTTSPSDDDSAATSDADNAPPLAGNAHPQLPIERHEDPVANAQDHLTWEDIEAEFTKLTALKDELETKCKELERQNGLLRNAHAVAHPHPTVIELQAELRKEHATVKREIALKAALEERCSKLQAENIQLRAVNDDKDAVACPQQRKVERVNFKVEKSGFALRAPSAATKPLETTLPDIIKCIEARGCSLERFRAALDAGKNTLLTVDAVDIADMFTAFASGRRFIPVLFEVYSDTPANIATFLWNFNIDSTIHYRRQRDDVLSTIARCPGFIQAMRKLVGMNGDVPEVVTWVLTILWPLSADFRAPAFAELADELEGENNDLNTFAEGVQLVARLKSVRTGVEHQVVLWNTHPNDPQDFRRVDTLPIQQELALADGLPAGQLSRLKFDVVHENGDEHVDRHFRLLREDQVATLRTIFANEVTPQASDKKKQKSRSVTLANCKPIRDGDVFNMTGTVDVPNKHPLLKKGNEWLKQSRSFFSQDTIVFLKCSDKVVLGVVVKPAYIVSRKTPKDLSVTVRFDPSFVPRITDKYVAISSTVQWKNLSYVLRSLQHMRKLPFENQIVRLIDEPTTVPPSPHQLEQLNADEKLTVRQHKAITSAITQKMTLIQGPPGTGKTFVGTRLVEALAGPGKWQPGDGVVIILAYTNHALDQLLLRVFDQFKAAVDDNEDAVTPLFLRLGAPESTKEAGVKKFMHDIKGDVEKSLFISLKKRQRDAILQLEAPQQQPMSQIAAAIHRQYEALKMRDFELNYWREKETDPKFKWAGKSDPEFFWNLWCSGIMNEVADDSFKKNFKLFQKAGPQTAARLELFKIPVDQRRIVMDKVYAKQANDVSALAQTKVSIDDQMDEARQDARARAIPLGVRIIGATTSFGAKNQVFLKALTTRYPHSTLLIEEAGEILEGHILACLEDKLRRVVMIGDHKQLPPKVEQYIFQQSSGKGYDLNCSMFQRMIEGGYPFISLDEQHRMFPALSEVLRKLSYPHLVDAKEIIAQKVTPIPGFEHQMMFFDHEFKESGGQEDSDSVSKCNPKEAEFVVRTAKYLSQQPNVKLNQMVILTPYLGQVKVIRESILKAGFKAALNDRDVAEMSDNDREDDDEPAQAKNAGIIRVSTIDNFQGEEADYVFVSLVRCNNEGMIGWLKEAPRLTVLLSRAKKGLLLFGSRSTFTAKRNCWDLVFEKLDCFANLSLKCSRHQHRFKVATVLDFNRLSPEGGCNQVCAVKMDCGHHCSRKCHRGDQAHRQAMQHCPGLSTVTCANGHVIEVACSKVYKKKDDYIRDNVCHVCQEIRKVEVEAAKELKAINDARIREDHNREVQRKRLAKEMEKKEAELASLEAKQVLDAEKEASRIKIEGLQREINGAKERMKAHVDAIRQATADETDRAERKTQDIERRTKEQVDQIREASAKAVDDAHALQKQAQLEQDRRVAAAVANQVENAERENALLERIQGPINPEHLNQQVQCQSCGGDDLLVQDAKVCGGGGALEVDGGDRHCHYFHSDCFDNMIESQLNEPQAALEGEVVCLYCKAAGPLEASLIPYRLVHLFASRDVAEQYDKNRLDAQNAKGGREAEVRVRHQLEAESVRDRLYRELSEEQNPKCPRCKLVFIDYNGCSALTCQCDCHFCALCLKDCGQDAHAHVANCPLNPQPGNVFLSQAVFLAANKLRGQRTAFEVLQQQNPDVQAYVWGKLFDDEPMPAMRP